MITKCIITKNPVCLELFLDQRGRLELCITFGGYNIDLCSITERMDGRWLIHSAHEEMDKWDDHEFSTPDDAIDQAIAAALDAFGLEKECEGKNALAAYMNKERKD